MIVGQLTSLTTRARRAVAGGPRLASRFDYRQKGRLGGGGLRLHGAPP